MTEGELHEGEPPSIRELFPPGDLVGEWVYSLSVLCDDLSLVVAQLKPAMEKQQLRETLYYSRQLFTRIYEARRLIVVTSDHPDIERLVIGADGTWRCGRLLVEVYRVAPGEERSRVEETFGPFRHQTVHLMWPGSAELRLALDAAGFLPARIWASDSGLVNQWVQGVSGMLLFGDVKQRDWMERFRRMNDLAGKIAGAWIMTYGLALTVYAKERGIDLARLHVSHE